MKRIERIRKELKDISHMNVYKIHEVIKERLKFYESHVNELENLKQERFDKFSFSNEVLSICEFMDKERRTSKILKRVVSLERHKYAPELNKLIFCSKDGYMGVKVNGATTIDDGVKELLKSMSIEHIDNIIDICKVIRK